MGLVLTCEGMGDCLFAIPVIRKLRRTYPYRFDLFTFHPALFKACPYIDEVRHINDPTLPYYRHNKVRMFELDKLPHWKMDTFDFISVPLGQGTLSFAEKQLEYFPQEPDRAERFDVVLNTSRTWRTRSWPIEHWQRLADLLVARGLRVAVVGKDVPSQADKMLKTSLPLAGNVTNLVNSLSLDQTYYTLSKAGLFVSGQGGLTVLAGAYPAFVMAAMSPANALHQGFTTAGTSRVRQWLVVTQLAILIALLVATAVIHRQTTFATKESLRISADQVLLVFAYEQTPSEAFKDALSDIPGVSGVTAATALPTNYDGNAALFSHGAGAEPVLLQFSGIDPNFFEFYRLQPLAGRLPSRDRGTDLLVMNDANRHVSLWLNEAAVRALGMASPAAAIGQQLKPAWPPNLTPPASITIAGVMPDFPVDSIRGPIQPVAYFVQPDFARIVSVRLRGEQIPQTLAAVDEVWKRLGEPRPISRIFLDHYYQRMYTDVIQQRSVLGSLCGVAVFLACLGLFGLSIYTAQRRTKEIGIRKVMGAATSDIMRLLLWAFSKPVFWGSLIAWPVAAWSMSRWLEGFVYRVDFGWWLLPVASLLALAVALTTVSVHSYLVARARPAAALRYQ